MAATTTPNSQALLNMTLQVINQLAQTQNPLVNTNIPNLTMNSNVAIDYSAFTALNGSPASTLIQDFSTTPIKNGLVVYVRNVGSIGTVVLSIVFNTNLVTTVVIPLGPGDVFLYFCQSLFSYYDGIANLQNGTNSVLIQAGNVNEQGIFEYLVAG